MTDRNQIITQVEELLGSEGSREDAERLFELFYHEYDYIGFDPVDGFVMNIPDFNDEEWNQILAEAEGYGR
jgi:hypothetical protein